MKTLLFFLVTLTVSFHAFGQEARGTAPVQTDNQAGNRFAIVVGISDYIHFGEDKDLNYADADAKLMADLLIERQIVARENLSLFLNDSATESNVWLAMVNTLLKKAQPNDEVIIYFAGHGDVHYDIGDGFLLMADVGDDSDYFLGGTIQISNLNKMVSIAINKNVKVWLITDACRSGKLVTDDNGAHLTTASLINSLNNSMKMISCGPDQLSFEYSDLGHGVFTYNLVQGLKGGSDDLNSNEYVDLFELKKYVEDNVMETTSYQQQPQFVGQTGNKLISRAAGSDPMKVDVNSALAYNNQTARGFEGKVMDEDGLSGFNVFQIALENGKFRDDFTTSNQVGKIGFEKYATSAINRGGQVDFEVDASNIYVVGGAQASMDILDYEGKMVRTVELPESASLVRKIDQRVLAASKSGKIYALNPVGKSAQQVGDVSEELIALDDAGAGRLVAVSARRMYVLSAAGEELASQKSKNEILAARVIAGQLVVGTDAGELLRYALPDLEEVSQQELSQYKIVDIEVAKADGFRLVGASDGNIYIFDDQWKPHSLKKPVKGTLTDLSVGYSIDQIVRVGNDFFIEMISENENQRLFMEERVYGRHIEVTPDLRRFVASNQNGQIFTGQLYFDVPFAYDFYKEQLAPNLDKYPKEYIKGAIAVNLENEANKVLEAIINGEVIQPSLAEIHEAIGYYQEILQLFEGDSYKTERIRFKLQTLKGYEIIKTEKYESFEEARTIFEKILEQQPGSSYPLLALSEINRLENNKTALEENLNLVIERIPEWSEPRNLLGLSYLSEGKFTEAEEQFRKIIELRPDKAKGYLRMAELYYYAGKDELSYDYLEQAESYDDQNKFIKALKAFYLLNWGRFDEALEDVNESLNLDSEYAFGYKVKADYYAKSFLDHSLSISDYRQAVSNYEKAIELSDKATYYVHAITELTLAAYPIRYFFERDIKSFDRQMEKLKVYYDSTAATDVIANYFNVVYASQVKGEKVEPADLSWNGPDYLVDYYRAESYAILGEMARALELYRASLTKNPQFFDAFEKGLAILARKRDIRQIQEFIDIAGTNFSSMGSYHYALAELNIMLNGEVSDNVKTQVNNAYTFGALSKYFKTAQQTVNFQLNQYRSLSSDEIQVNYDVIGLFDDGTAVVQQNGKMGIAGMDGRLKTPVEFAINYDANLDSWVLFRNSRPVGLVFRGYVSVPPIYQDMKVLPTNQPGEAFAMVGREAKYGVFNKLGQEIIPVKYDRVVHYIQPDGIRFEAFLDGKRYNFDQQGNCGNCN